MKLTVDYPSVAYREGPIKVLELARAIERIGYDEIAVFDHVVMGYPTEDRSGPRYPPKMPILEAMMLLAQIGAVTERIGLATEVLVLPQRQPVLAAKQFATLDTLSGGRVRVGVGVGWQEAEYDALGEAFGDRGRRMDEAISLMRACWGQEQIDFAGEHYELDAIAMEPKSPQGAGLPIWVGGGSAAALRRAGRLGDGWMGTATLDLDRLAESMATVRRHADEAGRDPDAIGMQMMLQPPPQNADDARWYADHDAVVARVERLAEMGFDWVSVNATAVFQAGARSVDAMVDELHALHERIRAAVGSTPAS